MTLVKSILSNVYGRIFFKSSAKRLKNSIYPSLIRCQFLHQQNSDGIQKVKINNLKETIQVDFETNSYQYPWIFLQDNCTCPECFHPSSKSRLKKMRDMNLAKVIVQVEHFKNPDRIKCVWSDGHEGIFDKEWLVERNFSEENVNKRREILRENPTFVGSDFNIQREKFETVIQDDKKLLFALKELATKGLFLLEDAPKKVGQLQMLANTIGFCRTTHYGNEFTVKSEKSAVNLAYTSATLGVHTDLPYYVYPPGTQFLHCIKQYQDNDGGYSLLVDGFNVANQMKQRHAQKFKTLCNTPLEFMDVGQDYTKFNKVHHVPTFVTNPETGKMVRINYSNQQLSSFMPVPIEKVPHVYEALKTFTDTCYDSKNLIRFKLKEGDIILFDNWRILHGREGFDPQRGERHLGMILRNFYDWNLTKLFSILEGIYVDWDEIHSKIRVIEAEHELS